jgi:hypothetical protein
VLTLRSCKIKEKSAHRSILLKVNIRNRKPETFAVLKVVNLNSGIFSEKSDHNSRTYGTKLKDPDPTTDPDLDSDPNKFSILNYVGIVAFNSWKN